MKKVLAIAPYPYLPYFSGGQKFIAQFFQYLGRETDLTVISLPRNDFSLAKNYKGIPLLKNSFARYYDLSLVKKISALVKEQGFDTLIWEHPYYAWLAFRVRKRTGVYTIIHTHNIEYQRFRSTGRWWWPVLKRYEKKAFQKADGIFFIAREDKIFAIEQWGIDKEKCFDLPFGVEIKDFPRDRAQCRRKIAEKHRIGAEEKIFLFTGLLNYKPNLDALKAILEKINPRLMDNPGFRYKILICGKGLPGEMNELKDYREKNILYAGFIEDIDTYCKAADLFLNPVQTGGGVKTKIVEAIAYGSTVISTQSGATGINKDACGKKLVIVEDNDWGKFTGKIIEQAAVSEITPGIYYQTYYWENVIKNMLAALTEQSSRKTKNQ